MNNISEVIIVGAGPYGLSIAAHLRARGVRFRIFGTPMQVWRDHMPRGMLLKSDGFASNLSSDGDELTLAEFCREQQIAYDDKRTPVRLDTFVQYGLAFQRRLVPELEDRRVISIQRHSFPGNSIPRQSEGFAVTLADGETVLTRQVVLAVGISHFAFTPENLEGVPAAFLSHSSRPMDPQSFRGRRVAVLGGGASAIDWAALLNEAGAAATVIARAPAIRFHAAPAGRTSWWNRVRHPATGIGPGMRSLFYTRAPHFFHTLPQSVRLKVVKRHLGPAAGWPMKERVSGKVPLLPGMTVQRAEVREDQVLLTLTDANGALSSHWVDHVIAATGYRADVRRLAFLSDPLRQAIRTIEHTPILSNRFESSVPGLYFVGAAAANSFGPMMRFAFGADYTARRISRHLARGRSLETASDEARQTVAA